MKRAAFIVVAVVVLQVPLFAQNRELPPHPSRSVSAATSMSSNAGWQLQRLLSAHVAGINGLTPVPTVCGSAPTLSCNVSQTASPSCLSGNYYLDIYTFNATAGQTLTLTATTLTGYQELITIQDYTTGNVIKSNFGLSPVTLTYTFPTTGPYAIGFGYVATFATGTYTLSLSCSSSTPPPSSGCYTAGTLTRGVPMNGTLSSADTVCSASGKDYYKVYEFSGTAGVPVRITVTASFPKYLEAETDQTATHTYQTSTPAEPYLIFYPLNSGTQNVWIGQDLSTPINGSFTVTITDEPLDPCKRRAVHH